MLHREYAHKTVNHAIRYVEGRVHTNGLENFWSLLKRGLTVTYVSVEPLHLHRYVDEQAYRFNERKGDDWGPPLPGDQADLRESPDLRSAARPDPARAEARRGRPRFRPGLTASSSAGAEISPRRIAAAVSGGTENTAFAAALNLSHSVM